MNVFLFWVAYVASGFYSFWVGYYLLNKCKSILMVPFVLVVHFLGTQYINKPQVIEQSRQDEQMYCNLRTRVKGAKWLRGGGQPPISFLVMYELYETPMYCVLPQALKSVATYD